MTTSPLDDLIRDKKIVVCVGSGGVGKTTTSAVLALHAALHGRKVLVLTIDPARRLANSLGVQALDNDERPIPIHDFPADDAPTEQRGQLFAMMLDMKRSFDRVVERYAPDEATRDKILKNKLYKHFSTGLAGTQEYSAMERLHSIYTEGDYDLIIMDTPPTVHALDFLDAPIRMAEAVESSALQWLYKPSVAAGKFGFGLFNMGSSYVLKTISRFTGGEMLNQLGDFLVNFNAMFEGFGTRARQVREILSSNHTLFLVVTSPDPATVDEARYFRDRLHEERIPFGGFLVNRVHKPYVPRDVLRTDGATIAQRFRDWATHNPHLDLSSDAAALDTLGDQLVQNAAEFQILADLDAQTLEALRERTHNEVFIQEVPFFNTDIHSLQGLDRVRRHLFNLPLPPEHTRPGAPEAA